MAGHSKWANIKHKKAAVDKKRGKIWTKLIREITVAAREGKTSDPSVYPRLRLAVDKALAANMPKDTIDRACKRGSGELGAESIEEIRYEGYGPGGVAILVDTETDNTNRTVSEVRHAFSRSGGNLGTSGSVSYLFDHLGVLFYEGHDQEETLMELALEAGAEDFVVLDHGMEVIVKPEDFASVQDALVEAKWVPDESGVTMRAENLIELDAETEEKVLKLMDALEDLDDVQEVISNAKLASLEADDE